METEIQSIRDMVAAVTLPEAVQRNVLWGVDQLPKLYLDLQRTYESRYSERILCLVQGILKLLTSEEAGPEGRELAEKIVSRLQAMHVQHGLAQIGLKPPAAAKPVRKKKVS